MNFIGKNLTLLIASTRLDRKSFCAKHGFLQSQLSQWINGHREPSTSILFELSKEYNFNINEFIGTDLSERKIRKPSASNNGDFDDFNLNKKISEDSEYFEKVTDVILYKCNSIEDSNNVIMKALAKIMLSLDDYKEVLDRVNKKMMNS